MTKIKFRVPVQRRKYKMPFLLMKRKRVEAVRRSLKQPNYDQMELRKDERVVWNVAERSEKVGYDPKTGTNWCHLPMEIRMKCIGEMDLVSRIHLSATSETEKSLVESSKCCCFDFVRIDYNGTQMTTIFARSNRHYREELHFDEKISGDLKMQFAKHLFRKCEIRKFEFCGSDRCETKSPAITGLRKLAPFGCREFVANCSDYRAVYFILKNCTQLETITFHDQTVFDTLAVLPPVVNVKEVHLAESHKSSGVWKLVQKWIEIDAEVGKSIQFVSSSRRTVRNFTSKFADRVLESDEQEVVIKMNSEDKVIVLWSYESEDMKLENKYISIRVFSKEGPEPEEDCDKWIEQRFEEEEDEKKMERCRVS